MRSEHRVSQRGRATLWLKAGQAKPQDHTGETALTANPQLHPFFPVGRAGSLFFLLLVGVLLARPLAASVPALEQVPCWFASGSGWPETTCFFMHVNEDHGNPQSARIRFPVVKFEGGSNDRPVLDLGGGGPGFPSGLGAEDIEEWIWYRYSYMFQRFDRDLYVIDPRGVGMAEPALGCFEALAIVRPLWARHLSVGEEYAEVTRSYERCGQRLRAEGYDLLKYNSAAVATDIKQLGEQLGIGQFSLYGASYASRYALTIARDYPEMVASMVLDGPVFPSVRSEDYMIRNGTRAIHRALYACTTDEACRLDFPDIEQRFWKLVDALNTKPMALSVTDPVNYARLAVTLTGDRFYDVVFYTLYDEKNHASLPELIVSMEFGNTDLVAALVRNYLALLLDDSIADATINSHYCFEEFPFELSADLEVPQDAPAFLVKREAQLTPLKRSACASWLPTLQLSTREGEAVKTAIPTLILSGELDPVIPIEDIDRVLPNFTNVAYYSVSDVAHGVVAVNSCAERIAGAFYEFGMEYNRQERCARSEQSMVLRYRATAPQ